MKRGVDPIDLFFVFNQLARGPRMTRFQLIDGEKRIVKIGFEGLLTRADEGIGNARARGEHDERTCSACDALRTDDLDRARHRPSILDRCSTEFLYYEFEQTNEVSPEGTL